MITPDQRKHLISIRLQQAEECIADVELSLANARHRNAANRIYYGMFYALLALGVLHDFDTSKHQQLIGWFNKNFVHTGIFSKHFSALIKRAFDTRTVADYKATAPPTAEDLETMLADMKLFISTVKTYLDEQLRAG